METATPIEKYTKAVQKINIPKYCPSSEDILRMSWLSRSTQVDDIRIFIIPSNITSEALRRIDFIQNDEWYQNEDLSIAVFRNSRSVLHKLNNYLKYIDPAEIGPSGNGTLIFHFQKGQISIALEVGESNIAHVYSNRADKFISGSSDFNDDEYWNSLLQLFDNAFN